MERDPQTVPLFSPEVEGINAAMKWFDQQWPFDPQGQPGVPPTVFGDVEVLPPDRLQIRHVDGYRIGWLENRDGQTVFVRDYVEER